MRKTLILTFILLSNSCFASNFLTGSIYERIANEVGLDPLLLIRSQSVKAVLHPPIKK